MISRGIHNRTSSEWKSTLVKAVFPECQHVNLEDPGIRAAALEDPVGFIRAKPSRLIIDEAQLAPELFSMMQVVSDEKGAPGQHVLSGSRNFPLLKQATQSLAGRVGILRLLPLSLRGAKRTYPGLTVHEFVVRGGYPRLYDVDIPPLVSDENYLETYIARDASGPVDPAILRHSGASSEHALPAAPICPIFRNLPATSA